ncbi:MAG TPA: 2'-5' RNA ligase family protein [Novosphingobium sp.]|mgnify:CR=1 FL=1|nr:2'-5' RNA ligase family protein [Novosphingobium sp.]HMP55537.1 2'-5' RNA ligase family protein [Novosphingobium sp.]
MTSPAPFIVTAELPGDVRAWADGLRRAHFPPERNWLVAHVTLFHAFAPSLREELHAVLRRFAAQNARPEAEITGLMNLGRGTALAIRSPGMVAIREAIADHFHGALTAQDSHAIRLHITIQNKVTPEAARALQAELGPRLKPRAFRFTGLGLHLYRNPTWEPVHNFAFTGRENG